MSTEQQPYLGRCKECDYALFVQADQVITGTSLKEVRAGEAPRRMADNGAVLARCPQRHRVFRLKQIQGKYSPDHKCDSRCMNAKGYDCTCSCGGMNHGRGHAIQVMTLDVPATNPEPKITPAQADRKEAQVIRGEDAPTESQLNYIADLTSQLGLPLPNEIDINTRSKASEFINELKAKVMDREPMSDGQRSYINSLMEGRVMPPEARKVARRQLDAGLSKFKASQWIDKLLTLPEIHS